MQLIEEIILIQQKLGREFLMQKSRNSNKKFYPKKDQNNFRKNNRRNNFSSNNRRGRRGGGDIDIQTFINKSIQKASEPVEKIEIKHTFADFNFSPEIQKNLRHKGYQIPTPIQDQAIKPILEGKDLIGMANTGTGKTAAFLLPMLEKVSKNKGEKVLIIVPTRELALQIEAELRQFSYGMRIDFVSCVGGMPINRQIRNLRANNPSFVIGTPGRIKDLTNRGLINLKMFGSVILDEVDRMLDMGFVAEIKHFLNQLPKERQSLYFSATMSPKIQSLIGDFSVNPVVVQVKSQEISANVEQKIVRANGGEKYDKLKTILATTEASKVLIFSETKRSVEKLSRELSGHGFKTDSIHGNKNQNQRQRALSNFKQDRVDILVATDVAARGIDVKNISHVINYTIPQSYTDYTHRIGRTGRANKKGVALTFVG